MNKIISPMSNYYHGKTIFLTGGSGFLGQLYIQKLLRTKIGTLYLFLRPKRGKSIEERLEKLFDNPVFEKLKLEVPDYLDKIKVIAGSLDQPGLGIEESDLNDIIDNVELVIHAAAEVRFDRTLSELAKVNLCGTRELLKLSTRMRKLRLFTYISTCYSNCVIDTIEERFYDPPLDPNLLIELTEKYSQGGERQEIFELLTTKFISPWPNTYTFTKALSESMVKSFEKEIPICVVRPSIVLNAYKDPEPGWIFNYFGFVGVIYAIALGISRVLYNDDKKQIDFICADFVTNSTLAVIWTMDDDQLKMIDEPRPTVYSVSSGNSNPVSFSKLLDCSRYASHIPGSNTIWYPVMIVTQNRVIYFILHVLLELIPAMVFDVFFKCAGLTIRLIPIYRGIIYHLGAVQYFASTQWTFKDDNMRSVYDRMTEYDKRLFPSDVSIIDWRNYLYDCCHGIRKYIHKDQTDWTTAFRRISILQVVHLITKFLFMVISIYVIYLFGMKLIDRPLPENPFKHLKMFTIFNNFKIWETFFSNESI